MIITCDTTLQRIIQVSANVASSKATVLIQGESGTGKELMAKYIHEKSQRSHKRFVAVNCAALPEGLLESELFGYEKGAFTGAFQQKLGKIELAHQGTFLLDEISEMSLPLQAKLLRVLQEEEVDRLGGVRPISIDVRFIATTNKNLKEMVQKGQFREDLYYRLNVIPLQIPALRMRAHDISYLAEHFIKVNSILNSKKIEKISLDALEILNAHSWPGNVRELENVIERAVLLSQGNEIKKENIFIDSVVPLDSAPALSVMTISEMEKKMIHLALEKTNQNRTKAADLLGISIRTLRNKLQEYRENGEKQNG